MKTLKELMDHKGRQISLELFPPKEVNSKFLGKLESFVELQPNFFTVTYGAAGGNKSNAVEVVKNIINMGGEVIPHVTCVNSTLEEVKRHLAELKELGVNKIVALRGDYVEPKGDFRYATDLMRIAKDDFELAGACYPELHPEERGCINEMPLNPLVWKQDKGCQVFFSQMFFEPEIFYRYLLSARRAGNFNIIPGLMPVINRNSFNRLTSTAGVWTPQEVRDMVDRSTDEELYEKGIDHCVGIIGNLFAHGVTDVHLYSLNNYDATHEIMSKVKNWLR